MKKTKFHYFKDHKSVVYLLIVALSWEIVPCEEIKSDRQYLLFYSRSVATALPTVPQVMKMPVHTHANSTVPHPAST